MRTCPELASRCNTSDPWAGTLPNEPFLEKLLPAGLGRDLLDENRQCTDISNTSKCCPVYLKNPVILINCLFLFKNTEFKIFRLTFGQMNPYHWLQLSSLTQILTWKKGRNTQGNYKCCANPQENNNFYLPPALVPLCNTQLSFLIPTLFLWSFPVHRPSQTFPILQAETEITAEVDKLSKRDRFWTWC